MDLTASKGKLLRALKRADDVADAKATQPILSHVLLSAEGSAVRVGATDLRVECAESVEAEVRRSGAVAIPARDLLARVSAIPDGPVHITSDDKLCITIKASSRLKYTLHGMPGADYPDLHVAPDDAWRFELPADSFARLVRRTLYAAVTDPGRPNIHCLCIEPRDGIARAVGTDGHRLIVADEAVEGLAAGDAMLLPLHAANALAKLAADTPGGALSCATEGRRIYVEVGGVRVVSSLVDQQFIPYEQVLPATRGDGILVRREELRAAVRNVALAATGAIRGVTISATDDGLRIATPASASGDAVDEVAADCGDKRITIGMSSKNIVETLTSIDCDEVRLWLGTDERDPETSPCVLRPVGDGESLFAILMPMRT